MLSFYKTQEIGGFILHYWQKCRHDPVVLFNPLLFQATYILTSLITDLLFETNLQGDFCLI